MINQQLLDFVKGQLQLGNSKENISKQLLSNGWAQKDIEEAFKIPISNNAVSKNKWTIFRSIWFWWFVTTAIYVALSIAFPSGATVPTFIGYTKGAVGLFVPYGILSIILFVLPGITMLLSIISVIFFIFTMYWINKKLNKKNYSLLEAILINLLVLLIITTLVDFIRLTPLASWRIFLHGGLLIN
jgi:hypothetical protein